MGLRRQGIKLAAPAALGVCLVVVLAGFWLAGDGKLGRHRLAAVQPAAGDNYVLSTLNYRIMPEMHENPS